MTFSEHLDRTVFASLTRTDPEHIIHIPIEIHEEDYEFYGRFVFTDHSMGTDIPGIHTTYHKRIHNGDETLLLGLPIKAQITLPVPCYILNILDERKYKPTPDRERLSEDASNMLEERITQKITDILADGEITNPLDFDTHKYRMLYNHVDRMNSILYCISENVTDILDFLNTKIILDTGKRVKIKEIVRTGTTLVRLRALKSEKVNALRKAIPKAKIFRFIPANNPAMDALMNRMQCNIIDGEEYLVRNRIKLVKNATGLKEISAKYLDGSVPSRFQRMKHKKVLSNALEDHMIRVSKNQAKIICKTMSLIESKYMIVSEHKRLVGGIKYDDFMRRIGNITVQTNDGTMTMNEVVACRKQVYMLQYDDPSILNQIKPVGDILMIFDNDGDRLFKIMAFLKEYDVQFEYENPWNGISVFWRTVGMDQLFNSSYINFDYVDDKEYVEMLLKITIHARSIKNMKLRQLFVHVACTNHTKKSIDDIYNDVYQLDYKITTL